jgi:hypothetical protein
MKKYFPYLAQGAGIFIAVFVANSIDRAAGTNYFHSDFTVIKLLIMTCVCFVGSVVGSLWYRLANNNSKPL